MIVTIANAKGGVAKTTSAIYLAAAGPAVRGKRQGRRLRGRAHLRFAH